ncbi:class 1 fructose-bisphosphatase [Aliidiomarina halalkaliphila]|uniref:Fructose-1,6-bisphosphatase class 1 n=1 Tax=Aliidiomarina halalkaliphila TaxID=2593535 RepID=A0A552WZD7_9GAMM|nr:class 1 fructose-bisphosphatase [Aliidiomarina halalkaliphila]TRW48181.1 class 1 fructose-bisphosphatase [Aliidiomarina halalkaliphila]
MQRLIPVLNSDHVPLHLISVINTLLTAAKEISHRLHQGSLAGTLGSTLDANIQGEVQKKLDVVSNQLIKNMLLETQLVHAVASEEEDEVVMGNPDAKYLVAYDPLDGSSNIDINGSVGTIFSILEKPDHPAEGTELFLQTGDEQIAAGYILYGPSTLLVMTTGNGVRVFTLDHTVGEFLLTVDTVTIPQETQEFAINMSNQRHWTTPMQKYIDDLLRGTEGPRAKNFNMRWNAAMVSDVHRVLTRSGIFTYPADLRNPDKPCKLRLMYEANPMSFLMEQAGGRATTGYERIMSIQPEHIHQRVSVIMGSRKEVDTCLTYFKKYPCNRPDAK